MSADEVVRVGEALVPLLAAWPEERMPRERAAAYAIALVDIDPESLRAAVVHCLATCRFFPKPAEIRSAAFELKGQAAGTPDEFQAWEEVTRAITEVGSYRVPEFSHPYITEAVRSIGGWRLVCLSEDATSDRARFLQAFKQLNERRERETRMLPAVREHVQLLAGRLSADRQIEPPGESK